MLAVDTKIINDKIMRGAAKPLGSLVATSINGYDESYGAPYKPDPERAKAAGRGRLSQGLLRHHGLPQRRYVNDERSARPWPAC